MAGHVVTAAAVRVVVGPAALIIERGQPLPAGVDPAALEHLVRKGLVSEPQPEQPQPEPVQVQVQPAPAVPAPVAQEPAVKPLDQMTLVELRAYAADKGIAIDGATDKASTLTKIQAAQA